MQYIRHLERGQTAPPALSLTEFPVTLTLDKDQYTVTVLRTAPDGFQLELNGSAVDVAARKLQDGSLLIQVDGGSHVTHAEDEASGMRLIVDNLTCLLPNERDPSCLRAHSPGKLLRYVT